MLIQHLVVSEMPVNLQSSSEEECRYPVQGSSGVSDDAVSSLPALSHSPQRLLEGDGSPHYPEADEKHSCGSLRGFMCC